jgi:hypothetical protein
MPICEHCHHYLSRDCLHLDAIGARRSLDRAHERRG